MLNFLIFISVLILLYVVAMQYSKTLDSSTKIKFNKNVLYVTAHPDDECMFFTPTIYAMNKAKSNLYLLVLSNGGYDGLGKIREKEMEKAAA